MTGVTIYLLATSDNEMEQIKIARPRSRKDLPVTFTLKLGRYFFDIAERLIQCEEGEEVILLSAQITIADIESSHDYIDHFKHRINKPDGFESFTVLDRRIAEQAFSASMNKRIRELYMTVGTTTVTQLPA